MDHDGHGGSANLKNLTIFINLTKFKKITNSIIFRLSKSLHLAGRLKTRLEIGLFISGSSHDLITWSEDDLVITHRLLMQTMMHVDILMILHFQNAFVQDMSSSPDDLGLPSKILKKIFWWKFWDSFLLKSLFCFFLRKQSVPALPSTSWLRSSPFGFPLFASYN